MKQLLINFVKLINKRIKIMVEESNISLHFV